MFARGTRLYMSVVLSSLSLGCFPRHEAAAQIVYARSSSTHTLSVVASSTSTSSSAKVNAATVTKGGAGDTPQAYVGPGPDPAENLFSAVGEVNGDYSRGDARVISANTTSQLSAQAIAESFLTQAGTSEATAQWEIDSLFFVSGSQSLTFHVGFTGDLSMELAGGTGAGTIASVWHTFQIELTPTTGGPSITLTPSLLNDSLHLTEDSAINAVAGPAEVTLSSGILSMGVYNMKFTGADGVRTTLVVPPPVAGVPEPTSLAWVTGLLLPVGWLIRRRTR